MADFAKMLREHVGVCNRPGMTPCVRCLAADEIERLANELHQRTIALRAAHDFNLMMWGKTAIARQPAAPTTNGLRAKCVRCLGRGVIRFRPGCDKTCGWCTGTPCPDCQEAT